MKFHHPSFTFVLLLGALCLPSCARGEETAPSIVSNGGFEAPALGEQFQVFPEKPAPDGWTAGGAGGVLWNAPQNPGMSAGEGTQFVTLNANGQVGGVSQILPTVAGKKYAVSFAWSALSNGDAHFNAGLRVTAPGESKTYDLTTSLPDHVTAPFHVEHFTFTAVAATSTLSFLSTTPKPLFYGTSLDNVIVRLAGASEAQPETDAPLVILPLGDSLTTGFNVTGGYRLPLQKLLGEAGCPADFVGSRNDNSGDMKDAEHSGYSGYNVIRLTPVALADLKTFSPDVTLLMIGTNNMNEGNGPEASKQLDALIGQITAASPQMPLIVATIPPIIPPGYFKNIPDSAPIQAFNKQVRDMVAAHAKNGERVALAEVFGALTPDDMDAKDKTHFLQSGADKVARVWFQALQREAFESLRTERHQNPGSVREGNRP